MKRLVLKVGTAVLTDASGNLDQPFIADLCGQIASAKQAGWKVVLVTSGAIKAGYERLALPRRPRLIPEKQAAAAVGQGLLLQMYTGALNAHAIAAAQMLLTRDDFSNRTRYLNARNTLNTILRFGAVPVINENDTVATEEIQFGDNDMLAALVGQMADAQTVLLLTDVEGLCESKPQPGTRSVVIPEVREITPELLAKAQGGSSPRGGTGGMASKLAAARIAMASGVRLGIVPGREPDVVSRFLKGERIGTRFIPSGSRMASRKRWIAFAAVPSGSVTINERACAALVEKHTSLLAVGIVAVDGDFVSGDLVRVIGPDGRQVARGFANYSSAEVRNIMGKRSSEIMEALGHKEFDEVIHRDNLVIEA